MKPASSKPPAGKPPAGPGANREVELKFLCTPQDLAAVLAAAPAGDDESRELISVYFDTADRALQKAGVSLRVRESKGLRVQTLKRGEGLSREEHEAAIDGFAPDPQIGPLKALLAAGESLAPAFNVRVTRRQRTLTYAGATIELALDQGEVTGGAAQTPICEVELELKVGPPAALFALARDLSAAAPLYISFDGKAARGQALVAGVPLSARRSGKVALAAGGPAAEAFQAIARQAIGQIAANAAVLRTTPGAEAVHQLRVGVRRLRSTLSTFKSLAAGPQADAINADLRWLGRSCDAARNLDVFAASLPQTAQAMPYPPVGLAVLAGALDTLRHRAWSDAAEAVASARFRALMIDATAWVETGAWQFDLPQVTARVFAAEALSKRHRKVLKQGRDLKHADDTLRHALRIEAKKLRYAAEAFADLHPRKAQRFIGEVKALQTALGDLNDLATAGPLVAGLALKADAALAAGELVGWRTAGKSRLIETAEQAFGRLKEAKPFWQ